MFETPTSELTRILKMTPQNLSHIAKKLSINDSDYVMKARNQKFYSSTATRKILEAESAISYGFSRTVGFVNNKGGVGKTTTTINVAYRLASLGMKVLIIDNDPQANTTSYFTKGRGISFKETLKEVVTGSCPIKDAIVQIETNLHLIPSRLDTEDINQFLQNKLAQGFGEGDKYRMEGFYKSLLKELDYEFILWDMNPSWSTSTKYALLSCDEVVVVANLEEFSTEGLISSKQVINAAKKHFQGFDPSVKILLNKIDGRATTSFSTAIEINDSGLPVFESTIRIDSEFQKAQKTHTPLPYNSRANTDITNFVYELIGLTEARSH